MRGFWAHRAEPKRPGIKLALAQVAAFTCGREMGRHPRDFCCSAACSSAGTFYRQTLHLSAVAAWFRRSN